MKRNFFDLEQAQFIEEVTQNADYNMQQYEQNYSLLIQQVQKFFQNCRHSIDRYFSLTQLGFGINLPFYRTIFTNFSVQSTKISNSTQLGRDNRNLLKKQQTGESFEQQFKRIINKMNKVIQQFLKFEQNMKQEYFSKAFSTATNSLSISVEEPKLDKSVSKYSEKTKENDADEFKFDSQFDTSDIHSKQETTKLFAGLRKQDREAIEEIDKSIQVKNEEQIRKIINDKFVPIKLSIQPTYQQEKTPDQNFNNLNNKLDLILNSITTEISNQQSKIKIFNDNRVQLTLLKKPKTKRHSKVDELFEDNSSKQQKQSSKVYRKRNESRKQYIWK